MRLLTHTLAVLGVLFMLPLTASADHTVPEGSIERLHESAEQLDYAVRYSSLRYQVKYAVSQFAWNVNQFCQCAHGGIADDHTIPESCEGSMHQVRYNWYSVDRYLWDSYYDYPYVYRAYRRVQDALRYFPF